MTGYLAVAIYFGLIIAFAVVSLAAARLLSPSRPFAAKLESYECGAVPIGEAWVQFPVGFYLVALVFIVFDALAVFLFPWVLALRGLAWGIDHAHVPGDPSLGWVYAYREDSRVAGNPRSPKSRAHLEKLQGLRKWSSSTSAGRGRQARAAVRVADRASIASGWLRRHDGGRRLLNWAGKSSVWPVTFGLAAARSR